MEVAGLKVFMERIEVAQVNQSIPVEAVKES